MIYQRLKNLILKIKYFHKHDLENKNVTKSNRFWHVPFKCTRAETAKRRYMIKKKFHKHVFF